MTCLDSHRLRFVKLAERLAPGRDRVEVIANGWFDVLAGLYSEPHRHYHSGRHIANLLGRLDALVPNSAPHLDRLLEAEVAIWFHDAVYEIGSKRNEETSALLARAFLFSLGATDDGPTNGNRAGALPEAVNEAILATKHTGGDLSGNAARVMVDLDMAGFADPWDDFEENNRRIRLEYAAASDDAYRAGRVAFLAQLLTRPIYRVLTELETPARANIERHMRDLMRGRLGSQRWR